MDTSIDMFLGNLVQLMQEKQGYRATSDSVLASAAVPAKEGESVLDVGTGTGVILFCLNARVKNLNLTGVELQEKLYQLALQNNLLNGADAHFLQADIFQFIPELLGRQFHHVVTNPPFYTEDFKRRHEQTAIAYHQKETLENWLSFCVRHVRPKGSFTLIHRPEALPEILAFLRQTALGGLEIIPVQSKEKEDARRIIVRGRLGSKKQAVIKPALIMHKANGERSLTAEEILRFGKAI